MYHSLTSSFNMSLTFVYEVQVFRIHLHYFQNTLAEVWFSLDVIKEQHKTDCYRLLHVANSVRITLGEFISNMLVIPCRLNCFVRPYFCEETCNVPKETNTSIFRLEVTAARVRICFMTFLGMWLCNGSCS